VILTNNFKIAMLHVGLDWQTIYEFVLEKAFFFILWRFYCFFGSFVEKFENGPSES
jgi:hypothetical protein